jgi:hypothetical protein
MTRSNPEAVRRLLERLRDRGAFPERPVIRRFEVQADHDYSGDPAYYITVLVDDATPEEDLVRAKTRPIEDLIFEKLYHGPEDRWPYVRTIRESERYMAVEE